MTATKQLDMNWDQEKQIKIALFARDCLPFKGQSAAMCTLNRLAFKIPPHKSSNETSLQSAVRRGKKILL
mgnify:CR=1 FL=1